MGISFTQPLGLLLLALLPLAVWTARHSQIPLARARRRWSLGLRLVLLTLLALAVAGTQVVQPVDTLAVIFLLDRSDSVPVAQQSAAVDFVRGALPAMGPRDLAAVVAFGAEAVVDRPLIPDHTLAEVTSKPASTFSNLADAIRLSTALLPPAAQGRIVLLSDGNENLDSAENAARLAAARGVRLDVVPLAPPPGREVLIDGLEAPGTTREGERFDLRISLRSTATTSATLRLLVDGNLLGAQEVQLSAGSSTFVQPVLTAGKGFHIYRAEVLPAPGSDTRVENNVYSAYNFVVGKPRVLLVEGHPAEAQALAAALTAAGLDSDTVAAPTLPLDLTRLSGYEAVVLVDVPITGLPKDAQPALQTYVRDLGRGLLVVGGEESYGAGGYFRTTLEQLLPLTMDLPSAVEIPAVGMVLVIDRSGSMEEIQGGGVNVTKIEMAKEAAFQAIRQLSTNDSVGVVTFDTEAAWNVPLQKMGDPETVRAGIASIGSGGGTYIFAGLDAAVTALEKSTARAKHIVLLTDGVSEGGDYEGALKRMEAAHITLSTVGLGSDVDRSLLSSLAARGGGRFYNTLESGSLPAIFAHESHLASRSYLIEHAFVPKRTAPSPIIQDIADTPPLRGYVGTTVRPEATLVLVSDSGDPLLAHWQYGLGRVAAWTSDAKGRWATDWIGWAGFPTFWGAAARWVMGTDNGGGLQAQVSLQDNQGHVNLDAVSGSGAPLNGLQPQAAVVAPGGASAALSTTLPLRQTAPGHYEGTFPVDAEGAYLVRVQAGSPEAGGGTQTVGLVVPYSPEYRALPGNSGLLAHLTAATAGRTLALDPPSQAAVFTHDLPPVSQATDLWPLLLLLAILLLPFDIGARRVAVGWRDLPRFWAELRGRLRPAVVTVPGDAAASAALGPLFEARRRAESRVSRPAAAEIARRLEREQRAAADSSAPPQPGPQPLPGGSGGVQLTGRTTESPPPTAAESPAAGNLAGEVLRRRRERE